MKYSRVARESRHEPFDMSSARMGLSARRPRDKRNSRILRHVSLETRKIPNVAAIHPTVRKNQEEDEISGNPPANVRVGAQYPSTNIDKCPRSANQRQYCHSGTPRSPQDPQKPHGHCRRRERRTHAHGKKTHRNGCTFHGRRRQWKGPRWRQHRGE